MQGVETDVGWQGAAWIVGVARGGEGTPLDRFLRHARSVHQEGAGPGRLKVLLEVRAGDLDASGADDLLDQLRAGGDVLEVRLVSYLPETVNTLFHATMSRETPVGCQVYLQEDNILGHVQWSRRSSLGLPGEIGHHLRLHAFPSGSRPTYKEAAASGRRISTTGWNPLYRGWRDIDLSHIWNVKRQ